MLSVSTQTLEREREKINEVSRRVLTRHPCTASRGIVQSWPGSYKCLSRRQTGAKPLLHCALWPFFPHIWICSSLQISVHIAADVVVCVSGNSGPETAGDRKACKFGSKLTFRKWYLGNFPLCTTLISSLYISQTCGLCESCYAQAFLCSTWTEYVLGV